MMLTLTKHKTAFETISKMVKSANPRIQGVPDTECMQYINLFDERTNNPYDGIASMEDFYDEMDENEVLMHKTKKSHLCS